MFRRIAQTRSRVLEVIDSSQWCCRVQHPFPLTPALSPRRGRTFAVFRSCPSGLRLSAPQNRSQSAKQLMAIWPTTCRPAALTERFMEREHLQNLDVSWGHEPERTCKGAAAFGVRRACSRFSTCQSAGKPDALQTLRAFPWPSVDVTVHGKSPRSQIARWGHEPDPD